MKRIKLSSMVTAGLLLVGSAEFTMAMKGRPLETIHEGKSYYAGEDALQAPSAGEINAMVEGNTPAQQAAKKYAFDSGTVAEQKTAAEAAKKNSQNTLFIDGNIDNTLAQLATPATNQKVTVDQIRANLQNAITPADDAILTRNDSDYENGVTKYYESPLSTNRVIVDSNGTIVYSSDPESSKNILARIKKNNPDIFLTYNAENAISMSPEIKQEGNKILYTSTINLNTSQPIEIDINTWKITPPAITDRSPLNIYTSSEQAQIDKAQLAATPAENQTVVTTDATAQQSAPITPKRLTQEEINKISLARKEKPIKRNKNSKNKVPAQQSASSKEATPATAAPAGIDPTILSNYRTYIINAAEIRYKNPITKRLTTASDINIIQNGDVSDLGNGKIRFTLNNNFVDVPTPTKDYLAPDRRGFMEYSNTPEYQSYIKENTHTSASNPQRAPEVTLPAIYQPKSQEVQNIINDSTKNAEEINQSLITLVNSSNDRQVLNDIMGLNRPSINGKDTFITLDITLYNAAEAKLNIIDAQNDILANKNLDVYYNINSMNFAPNDTIIELYMPEIKAQVQESIDRITNNPRLTPEAKSTQLTKLKTTIENQIDVDNAKIKSWYTNQIKPLYDTKITALATTKGTIDQLNIDITNLNKQSDAAWNSYLKNLSNPKKGITSRNTQTAFNKYTSTTLTILWKRGAVTAKSIKAAVMNIFKQAKAVDTTNVAGDMSKTVPPVGASDQTWQNWIANGTQRISDAIFGSKAPVTPVSTEL